MNQLTNDLIDNGGELTDDMVDRIEVMNIRQETIADAITSMNSKIEADAAAIDAEIKRLQGLKKVRIAARDSLKRYLLYYMDSHDIPEIETPYCRVKLTKGRESVQVDDAAECASYKSAIEQMEMPNWVKVELSVNKTEMMKWIKDGKPTKTAVVVRNPGIKFS